MRRGSGTGEPGLVAHRSAPRPRDLEGLPQFAGPYSNARGRRCHVSPGSSLPCDPKSTRRHVLKELSRTAVGRGDVRRLGCSMFGVLNSSVPRLVGTLTVAGNGGLTSYPHLVRTRYQGVPLRLRRVPSRVPPRRWVAGPAGECHLPGGLCPEGVEGRFPGAGEMRTSRAARFICARRFPIFFCLVTPTCAGW